VRLQTTAITVDYEGMEDITSVAVGVRGNAHLLRPTLIVVAGAVRLEYVGDSVSLLSIINADLANLFNADLKVHNLSLSECGRGHVPTASANMALAYSILLAFLWLRTTRSSSPWKSQTQQDGRWAGWLLA
jgi:hypothetical protein